VFVHDTETGTTVRVSLKAAGVEADGDSTGASISADGQYVTFTSNATNLLEGAVSSGVRQVYRVRRQ
ncbi:MAG: PD40 domain-containing protein, partial [Proteobacteria bacterium]|nr:PD40 domain-containing protein [Pseudomonadota bacterium]